jgi:dihydroneopterin aldolase
MNIRRAIEVNDIRLYAFHGCMAEEELIGSNYQVDVYLETDFSGASTNDDLTKTVDYVVIHEIVKEEMKIRAKLLEVVAHRIVEKAKLRYPELKRFQVKIAKISPPINGDVGNVSIIIDETF